MSSRTDSANPAAYAYQRLSLSLRRLIVNGTLRGGERLPSVRALCRREAVSPATALLAYAELERAGLVEVRERSGHYVRSAPRVGGGAGERGEAPRSLHTVAEPTRVGVSDEVARIFAEAANPLLVPLGAAIPAPELLPLRELGRCLAAAARREPDSIGRYDFGRGHEGLRRALARRFAEIGCEIAPDEITITAGAMEALNLAVRATTRPGDVVVVESPGYFGLLEILESLGLKALPVSGDCERGLDLEALASALEDHPVKAVVLVTSYSNPTGACLDADKRRRLVGLLADYGVPLIEDDIYGDLNFGDERPRPARAWDRGGEVLYCGSFSKALAPGLRLGWVAGGRFQERVQRLKTITSVGTAGTAQAALAEYLDGPGYDRHLRRLRRAFAAQVRHTRELVLAHFPDGTVVSDPAGGCFVWVQMPVEIDALELHRLAAERGVGIAPGTLFCPHGRYRNYVRLGCGQQVTARVEAAIRTLGELVARLGREALRPRGA